MPTSVPAALYGQLKDSGLGVDDALGFGELYEVASIVEQRLNETLAPMFRSGEFQDADGNTSIRVIIEAVMDPNNDLGLADVLSTAMDGAKALAVLKGVPIASLNHMKATASSFLSGETDAGEFALQAALGSISIAWGVWGASVIGIAGAGLPVVAPAMLTAYVGTQLTQVCAELAISNRQLRGETDEIVQMRQIATRTIEESRHRLAETSERMLSSNQAQLEVAFAGIESTDSSERVAGLGVLLALTGAEADLLDFAAFDEFMMDESSVLIL